MNNVPVSNSFDGNLAASDTSPTAEPKENSESNNMTSSNSKPEWRDIVEVLNDSFDSEEDSSSSSSSEASSDSSSSSSEEEEEEEDDKEKEDNANGSNLSEHGDEGARGPRPIRNKKLYDKYEMGLDKLPPVDLSRLEINARAVKEEDCIPMGNIINVIETLVVIQGLPNIPAHNDGSLLFLDKGKKILGEVHEVFGSVKPPNYVVRFNSNKDIHDSGIEKGLTVYSAPSTNTCKMVLVTELMQDKGIDKDSSGAESSSEDDFDEVQVQEVKNTPDVKKKKRPAHVNKHKIFEAKMNYMNKLDTARHEMHVQKQQATRVNPNPVRHQPPYFPPMPQMQPPPIRQPTFPSFPQQPGFVPPPFNYMHPAMMNFNPFQLRPGLTPQPVPFPQPPAQFHPPPNQQFAPTTFCPPSIPPLPAMPPQSTHQMFTPPMQFAPSGGIQIPQQPPPPGISTPYNGSKAPTLQRQQYNSPPIVFTPQKAPYKQANQSQTNGASNKPNNNNKNQTSSYTQPPPPLPLYDYQQQYVPTVALPNTSIPPPPFTQNIPMPNMPPPGMPPLVPPHMGPPIPTWSFQSLPTQTPPHVGGNF